MPLTIAVDPHPLLELAAFVTRTAQPTSALASPPEIPAPFASSDAVRTAVRDLLRHGGFKPSGRSKPAPEYLAAAAAESRFPRINPLVDACNLVSLHSGLPISLVDVDRLTPGPLVVKLAPAGTTYVFNPAGQIIDVGGLLCLYDPDGPTGTPVKDAQRTKTSDATTASLAILWGTRALPGRAAEAARYYRELLSAIATTEDVTLQAC